MADEADPTLSHLAAPQSSPPRHRGCGSPCLYFLSVSSLDMLGQDLFRFNHDLQRGSLRLKSVLTACFREPVLRSDSGPGLRLAVPAWGAGRGLPLLFFRQVFYVLKKCLRGADPWCVLWGSHRQVGFSGGRAGVFTVIAGVSPSLSVPAAVTGGLVFVLGAVPDPPHTQGAELLRVGDGGPSSVSPPGAPLPVIKVQLENVALAYLPSAPAVPKRRKERRLGSWLPLTASVCSHSCFLS